MIVRFSEGYFNRLEEFFRVNRIPKKFDKNFVYFFVSTLEIFAVTNFLLNQCSSVTIKRGINFVSFEILKS